MVAPARKSRRAYWYWLLLLPALGLLFPSVYAKAKPELLGFPFFYWYQMLWILLTSIIAGVVYIATRERT